MKTVRTFFLKPLFDSPSYRQAKPYLVATGINKLGSVGLIFIPAYLIQIHLSPALSSWLVAIGASVSFVAPLLSGWLGDRYGAKKTILLSWLAGAIAFGFFAFSPHWPILLLALIVLARLSHAMFPPAGRYLIMSLVEPNHQREALGWGRTVNNLGQALAFGAATLVGKLGLSPLFCIDSLTSIFGMHFLRKVPEGAPAPSTNEQNLKPVRLLSAIRSAPFALWMVGAGIAVFQLLYELIEIGASSKLELLYSSGVSSSSSGVAWFSFFMFINTVLCGLLSIPATRLLKPGAWELLAGLALLGLGGSCFFFGMDRFAQHATWQLPAVVGLSSLIFTAGEILFGTTANYALMKLVPDGPYSMRILSITITLQQIGRFIGASIALPLAVYKNFGNELIACTCLVGLSFLALARREITEVSLRVNPARS